MLHTEHYTYMLVLHQRCSALIYKTNYMHVSVRGAQWLHTEHVAYLWVLGSAYNRALSFLTTDLTSLISSGRQSGVHVPHMQSSAGQFFASLDPLTETSSILGQLNTNQRNSVQQQFQDTFPGTTLPIIISNNTSIKKLTFN